MLIAGDGGEQRRKVVKLKHEPSLKEIQQINGSVVGTVLSYRLGDGGTSPGEKLNEADSSDLDFDKVLPWLNQGVVPVSKHRYSPDSFHRLLPWLYSLNKECEKQVRKPMKTPYP